MWNKWFDVRNLKGFDIVFIEVKRHKGEIFAKPFSMRKRTAFEYKAEEVLITEQLVSQQIEASFPLCSCRSYRMKS